jgi:hypothetical protein
MATSRIGQGFNLRMRCTRPMMPSEANHLAILN